MARRIGGKGGGSDKGSGGGTPLANAIGIALLANAGGATAIGSATPPEVHQSQPVAVPDRGAGLRSTARTRRRRRRESSGRACASAPRSPTTQRNAWPTPTGRSRTSSAAPPPLHGASSHLLRAARPEGRRRHRRGALGRDARRVQRSFAQAAHGHQRYGQRDRAVPRARQVPHGPPHRRRLRLPTCRDGPVVINAQAEPVARGWAGFALTSIATNAAQ